MMNAQICLYPAMFAGQERLLLQYGALRASTFTYESGVCALRLCNDRGELVILPFQGQQIWRAVFDGRDLTMRSMFDTPRATRNYLENYGGFLIHCGFTAMGVPAAGDTHPLHGELPNAPYSNACLITGTDEQGEYVEVRGQYQHTVAFTTNYLAEPHIRLYTDRAVFEAGMSVTNQKHTPMEYLYLAHVNFRPVDDGRLEYTAPYDSSHVRVRTSIPSHVHPLPGYTEFLAELAQNPQLHHRLAPGLAFDPEVVFFIDYTKDSLGWAHSVQIHPDGTADYLSHQPDQLDHGVRWICRTPDQDAIGIILPATAEPEGYLAEKAKGNVKILGAQETWHCTFHVGLLSQAEAQSIQATIQKYR